MIEEKLKVAIRHSCYSFTTLKTQLKKEETA